MTDALGRFAERREIGEAVARICKDATDDPIAQQRTLAHLVANGVLAICNLAETIDARGASICDAVRYPEDES